MSRIARSRAADAARRPLAPWDDDHWSDPRVLWWARLDERYLVEARLLPGRRALLLAFDHLSSDALVIRQVVRLVGEPRYGPDPDDVDDWQRRAIRWVDGQAGASPA